MLHSKIKIPKRSFLIAAAIALLVSSFAIYFNPASQAITSDELRDKAKSLEAQIQEANKAAEGLAKEVDSLKRKIGELDNQITKVTAQIQLTNVKLQELEVKLNEAQIELDRQKGLLKASVVTLYKKGGASEVELLVGSDSFSTYFNEQLYLEKLKAGVQDSTEKVIELKQQIQAQKEEQKELLVQQKAQKDSLAKSKAERQQILSETQGREASYRERSKKLVEEQRKIFQELLLRSRVVTSVGSGGYPWDNAKCIISGQIGGSCWNYEWVQDGRVLDPWGYYLRNCTSFVAWRVASTGKNMSSGMGNGGNWYYSAGAYGIPRGQTPKVGAAAVFSIGYYGHVAYVEEVLNGGSQIRVSEYNFVQDGVYSERVMSASVPSGYVYFN